MIRVKYVGNPEFTNSFAYQTIGSAGVDLVSQENAVIDPGEVVKIDTGVFIDLSQPIEAQYMGGCLVVPELQLRMRSSMAANTKLRFPTSVSTIDCDYPGQITVMFENIGTEEYTIREGQRIAQLVQVPTFRIKGVQVKDSVRSGGFGSTNP